MRVLAIVAAAGLIGCTSSHAVECEDHTLCPEGERCVSDDALPSTQCAPPSSFTACEDAGLVSGDACTIGGAAGTCFGGACIARRCGDLVVDSTEVCDDGNAVGGDGCSATCDSRETCGNGVTDLSAGEQCDDGTPTLAGDGCTRTCLAEYQLWRDLSPTAPSSRTDFGLATDPVEGIVMFGGRDTNLLAETWRWTGSSWIPASLAYPSDGPVRRNRFAMAYDDVRHRVVVFGGNTGVGATGTGARNDTWEWDGLRWTDVSPPTGAPSARTDATLACGGGRCILVGGKPRAGQGLAADCALAGSPNTCDAWSWDGTTWTKLPAPPVAFTARAHPAIAYHAGFNTFVIFGGSTGSDLNETALGDTWELDAANTWTNRTQSGPLATSQPTAVSNEGSVLMVAGTSAWAYGASPGQHTWASRAAPFPWSTPTLAVDRATAAPVLIGTQSISARFELSAQVFAPINTGAWTIRPNTAPRGGVGTAAAAYDRARGRSVVLDQAVGTLEWDGVGWRNTVAAAAGPPDSLDTALAYDARCGVTVAFGGRPLAGSPGNRTWTYDGASWHEVTPAGSPAARSAHVMAYAPAHDAIVMFGGTTSDGMTPGTLFDDVWVWSGATCATRSWHQLTVTGDRPAARRNTALAFDASDATKPRMILFGGTVDNAGAPYNDETWQLELTSATSGTWTQLMPPASPSGRAFHGMTTDPRRGRVVMFAGRSADTVSEQDTWELDRDTWRATATVTTPPRRYGFAMTYDVTGDIIVVGGANGSDAAVSQVYRLSAENSLLPIERCLIATADDDGDGLAGCDDPDCWSRCAPTCGPYMTCDAAAPRCGDGVCDPTEDFLLCDDCSPP